MGEEDDNDRQGSPREHQRREARRPSDRDRYGHSARPERDLSPPDSPSQKNETRINAEDRHGRHERHNGRSKGSEKHDEMSGPSARGGSGRFPERKRRREMSEDDSPERRAYRAADKRNGVPTEERNRDMTERRRQDMEDGEAPGCEDEGISRHSKRGRFGAHGRRIDVNEESPKHSDSHSDDDARDGRYHRFSDHQSYRSQSTRLEGDRAGRSRHGERFEDTRTKHREVGDHRDDDSGRRRRRRFEDDRETDLGAEKDRSRRRFEDDDRDRNRDREVRDSGRRQDRGFEDGREGRGGDRVIHNSERQSPRRFDRDEDREIRDSDRRSRRCFDDGDREGDRKIHDSERQRSRKFDGDRDEDRETNDRKRQSRRRSDGDRDKEVCDNDRRSDDNQGEYRERKDDGRDRRRRRFDDDQPKEMRDYESLCERDEVDKESRRFVDEGRRRVSHQRRTEERGRWRHRGDGSENESTSRYEREGRSWRSRDDRRHHPLSSRGRRSPHHSEGEIEDGEKLRARKRLSGDEEEAGQKLDDEKAGQKSDALKAPQGKEEDGVKSGESKPGDSQTEEKPETVRKEQEVAKIKSSSSRMEDEVGGRAGGVYIPPFKLRRLESGVVVEKNSEKYQKRNWEALRRSLNGMVNKVTILNITKVVEELFRENLIRGRGLLARAILRAQLASPGFSHIFAALLAVINSKLPQIGELVIKRLLLQFRRSYKRNDRIVCVACIKFFAHLVNQKVVSELLALELCQLMLEEPTNDSVEVCCEFLKEVGQCLTDVCNPGLIAIFDRLREILTEGVVEKRTQYTIEDLMKIRSKKFSDYPSIMPVLDLLEEDDRITHEVDLLEEKVDSKTLLDVFKAVPPDQFEAEEARWQEISKEILGVDTLEDSHSKKLLAGQTDDVDEAHESSSDSETELVKAGADEAAENNNTSVVNGEAEDGKTVVIRDLTETDLIALRKTIYLCIMSCASFEESVHKLMKLDIPKGYEIEICRMLIDCCAMERTYELFFSLQADRLCRLKPIFQDAFVECFVQQYETVHRLETNKLRNVAKFFGHLFATFALPWSIMSTITLTEETTTAASRIFVKNMFQDMVSEMGYDKLRETLGEPELQQYLTGLFPRDSAPHMRFSINFFTAIGLARLADPVREMLTAKTNNNQVV